jgi:hypothetical protein
MENKEFNTLLKSNSEFNNGGIGVEQMQKSHPFPDGFFD